MLICPGCRSEAERDTVCDCGSAWQAEVRSDRVVVGLYGEHGIACQNCGEALDLEFRHYRKVIGWFVFDHIDDLAGYYCAGCRGRLFRRYQGLTLLLGWWGVFALLFRNPYAIGVNLRALVGPPRAASWFGATTLNTLDDGGMLASGAVPDTWLCKACGDYFVGFHEARDHADLVHGELLREDARAALKQISLPAGSRTSGTPAGPAQ
jgi:hypothetical protein